MRFVKPIRKNESERICWEKLGDEAAENSMKNDSHHINIVFKATAIFRKEIIN